MIHELKAWPVPFEAIIDGSKTHEIRVADRPYAVGDTLRLREWDPKTQVYTGREATVDISYISHGGEWELPRNVCVMSVKLRWIIG